MRILEGLILAVTLGTSTAVAAQMPALTPLSGAIVSSDATRLTIKTASSTQTVALGPKTRFFSMDKSTLANVRQGTFIGTTVVPQANGTYTSTEVHIFAPSLRGMGEGFTKMDARGRHMMANSTVRTVERPRMMANSTVRSVGSNGVSKTITMTFPSGTKTIAIPANVPVVSIDKGTRALLVPGAHVRLGVMNGWQGPVANFLLVGEHGLVPPM